MHPTAPRASASLARLSATAPSAGPSSLRAKARPAYITGPSSSSSPSSTSCRALTTTARSPLHSHTSWCRSCGRVDVRGTRGFSSSSIRDAPKDPYATLGVQRDAGTKDIKRAYYDVSAGLSIVRYHCLRNLLRTCGWEAPQFPATKRGTVLQLRCGRQGAVVVVRAQSKRAGLHSIIHA